MKKVLAFILCICLIISSFGAALTASADGFASVFDNPDNWVRYSSTSGLGTTATLSSWGSVALNTDTTKTYGGDASSLRLRAYAQCSTVQFEVTPNTEYNLSYRMYYDGTPTDTAKLISTSAIVSVGGAAEWSKDGCYDIYTAAGSARCDGGLWETSGGASSTTSVRGNVTQWKTGNEWHQVNHSFNSGDNTTMMLAVRVTAANDNNFYLDDFNLEVNFEDATKWGRYVNGTNATFDGTVSGPNSGWPSISLNTNTTYCYNNTGKSIKLYGNTTINALTLPTLEKYTEYEISFKYHIPADAAWGSSTKAWFTSYLYKKGAAIDANVPTTYYKQGSKANECQSPSDGGWYDYTFTFTTDNTTDYLFVIYSTLGGNPYSIYIDEMKLTSKGSLYENPITLSFDSNGGSAVEPMMADSGKAITVMPEEPTRDGFTFAGWYTDSALTSKFLEKIAPEEDATLYAKWIQGVYQDFENFTTNTYNPTNSEILNDANYSYDGAHSLKANLSSSTTYRVIVAQKANEKLSVFANPGDKVIVSFKYKLVSGSADLYLHSSTSTTNVNHLAGYTNANGGTSYANGYVYSNTTFTETSDEWKTFTRTYTLNSQEYLDNLGVEAEDALGYTQLFFTATSDNTEFYLDDVMVRKTLNVPVNYSTEAVRLEPANANKPLTAAIQGDTVSFKAVCDASVTPTVKYGDTQLTPVDGVYTITVTADDELTVTAEGVTDAQNHAPGVGLNGEDLTKYDADVFSKPVWEGDTVYHEAVMFVNSYDGTVQTTKKLLYPIDDVISVRNDDLNVWYVKGVDFDVVDGKLVWLEGGKCPIYTGSLAVPTDENDSYYDEALNYGGFSSASAYYTLEEGGDMGLYLMSDGKHEDHTLYVTYKHSTTWDELGEEGYTPSAPENQSYDMENFYDKLATAEDVNVLVYGASTATGCSSTGANVNYELFSKTRNEEGTFDVTERKTAGSGISAPTFFEQATAKLVEDYGNGNNINYYNIACGGTGAAWGAENLRDRVAGMNEYYGETIVPDIIYIKFAGNDVRTTPESYRASFTSMINDFKELYPNATIVLVSGKINNEKCYIFGDYHDNVLELEKVLGELADQYTNCIVAKTTSVWAEITESKDYEDYLSNNINHANDFWAKTTASIIVASAAKTNDAVGIATAYNNAAALRTAEGSSTGKNGLRIYNKIKADWLEAAEIVEYGSVAVFSSNIEGELTIENGRKGVAYSDGTFSAEKYVAWEISESSVVFTSYLTGIAAERYSEDILIRSYAIDKDGNVYYGDAVSVSVFDVANAIDNANTADGSEPSEADSTAFHTFVTAENKEAYAAWCIENGKELGTLYNNKYTA
ncbi:MAG: hypothetical protein E7551_06505 [Ruminococcaceae bacterium]|nr:hypothetical protein [Oscillospiraceae bacterium]